MAQAGLFDAADEVLADDERGRIEYRPRLLEEDFARQAFEALMAQVPWRAQRRMMYEREVDVPRLLGSYRLSDANLPPVIASVRARVGEIVEAPFDSVGLNLYRDGRDSVAPHNDHLYEIAAGQPIALVSLGAARPMVIRAKQVPRRVLKITLGPGSLLLMDYATQLHYDHGIPKQPVPCGPRISLAFRVKGGEGTRY